MTTGFPGESPLRAARRRRNWTLEHVVGLLDAQTASGSCGATPSMLSDWERGRCKTSLRYRQRLCRLYGEPPDVLFAHQDQPADPAPASTGANPEAPLLLTGFDALLEAMMAVVTSARECLVATGSRSAEWQYLDAIENAMSKHHNLVHYRVLYGPPQHQVLVEHLQRLLTLPRPEQTSDTDLERVHLAIVTGPDAAPERFFVASERMALAVMPSLLTDASFDTGVRLGPVEAAGLIQHARRAYAAARPLRTVKDVGALAPHSE
jgi:transcriptional regulator with XRE-family HTH domain